MTDEHTIKIRIDELSRELSECREDERNTQNQILQVIATGGTILGIIFGTNFWGKGIGGNLAAQRVLFWLSSLVFCAMFFYIIVLGISTLLRYYYIQSLEDRLSELIPTGIDDKDHGVFLHYNEFSAPIITHNWKHVASSHTVLHYLSYSLAIILAIVFSLGTVITQFLLIQPRKWYDTAVLILAGFVIVISFFLYLRLSNSHDDVLKFMWDTAHDNKTLRQNGQATVYRRAKTFHKNLLYLIYPNTRSIQKPLLIVLGFVYSTMLHNEDIHVLNLLLVLFVFDFLAYQARYQINDLRGIQEDVVDGKPTRLHFDGPKSRNHIIKISFITASIKSLASVLCAILLGGELRSHLIISLGFLALITIVYECARVKQIKWLIYIMVGMGYPLRFAVGAIAAVPNIINLVEPRGTVCLMLAIMTYGTFASLLSWAQEVEKVINHTRQVQGVYPNEHDYKKAHYYSIHSCLIGRFKESQIKSATERRTVFKITALREKGKLTDVWNTFYVLTLFFLEMKFLFSAKSVLLIILGTISLLVCFVSIFMEYKNIGICIIISVFLVLLSDLVSVLICVNPMPELLLSVWILIISITYYILRYQPKFLNVDLKAHFKRLITSFLTLIIGKHTTEMIMSGTNEPER